MYQLSREFSSFCSSLLTPKEFLCAYETSSFVDKNLLCELYLHNYPIPVDTHWNPLMYIGNIQLKAFMSYIQNQNNWGQQLSKYRDLELATPLDLRAETSHSDNVLCQWNQIFYEAKCKDIVM